MKIRGILLMLIIISPFLLLGGCVSPGEAMADEAFQADNPKLCDTLEESYEQTTCYAKVADMKNNASVCLLAMDPEPCVSQVAHDRQYPKDCDVLTDPVQRYTCVAKVTGDQTGRSIEIMIGDYKTKGKLSACIKECAGQGKMCHAGCLNTKRNDDDNCRTAMFQEVEALFTNCTDVAQKKFDSCEWDCTNTQYNVCELSCKDLVESK